MYHCCQVGSVVPPLLVELRKHLYNNNCHPIFFWLCHNVTLVNIQPVLFVYCTDIWNVVFEVGFYEGLCNILQNCDTSQNNAVSWDWTAFFTQSEQFIMMWSWRFPQQCCWRFKSFGMWCHAMYTRIQSLMLWKSLQRPSSQLFKKNGSHWQWWLQVVLLIV